MLVGQLLGLLTVDGRISTRRATRRTVHMRLRHFLHQTWHMVAGGCSEDLLVCMQRGVFPTTEMHSIV